MPIITSPLRYPGGKSGLSPFLAQVLETNGLLNCCFVEPFGGGAGAALNLLSAGIVKRIVINDVDPAIASIWKTILYHTDRFTSSLTNVAVTIDEWYKQKKIYMNPGSHTSFDLGFAAFFLNRTNRSGVLSANPIGGINQTGKWKINARFNKSDLIKRINHVASMKKSITILEEDAIDLLSDITTMSETIFVYIDPPYFNKGSCLYLNSYKPSDHEILAHCVTQQDYFPWLATYDDTEEIKWLYRHCKIANYKLNYHVTKWKIGKELCITPHTVSTGNDIMAFSYSNKKLHVNPF